MRRRHHINTRNLPKREVKFFPGGTELELEILLTQRARVIKIKYFTTALLAISSFRKGDDRAIENFGADDICYLKKT